MSCKSKRSLDLLYSLSQSFLCRVTAETLGTNKISAGKFLRLYKERGERETETETDWVLGEGESVRMTLCTPINEISSREEISEHEYMITGN